MKKVTTILAVILLAAVSMTAQTLSYSAVVRNSDNELVVNENLTVAIAIANSNGGAAVYSETHAVTTNQNGLVTLTIGTGTSPTGSMADVTWPTAYITSDYTLPNGSHVLNTTPVTAVPYALYAEKSGSSATGSTGSAHVSSGNVTVTMPISDFVNNLTDAEKAELCAALGCSSGGGGSEPGGEPTTFTCGTSKMVDASGNEYETIKMGVLDPDGVDRGNYRCWTKTNLRTTRGYYHESNDYRDFDNINNLLNNATLAMLNPSYSIIPPSVNNGNTQEYPVETYGYLYTHSAAMHACPPGWHLPTYPDDINALFDYVQSKSEHRCDNNNQNIAKALASKTGWEASNVACAVGNNSASNNTTGFSAVPAGGFALLPGSDENSVTIEFDGMGRGSQTYFWINHLYGYTTEYDNYGPAYTLKSNSPKCEAVDIFPIVLGYSVRCVRD